MADQTPLGSDVVEDLLKRNKAWAAQISANDPNFFPEHAQDQRPPILWIGCADSRISEGTITNSLPGHIPVHRNIANQFPQDDVNSLAVLHHAITALGVQHIIVVGHTGCGGVARSFANSKSPQENPTPVDRWIEPLTERAKKSDIVGIADEQEAISKLLQVNLQLQVDNIRKALEAIPSPGPNDNYVVPINGYFYTFVYNMDTGVLSDVTSSEE